MSGCYVPSPLSDVVLSLLRCTVYVYKIHTELCPLWLPKLRVVKLIHGVCRLNVFQCFVDAAVPQRQ